MGRLVTYDQYLNMVGERLVDNTKQLRRSVQQRRNGMEDLYGVCFSAHANEADNNNRYNAQFYVSLSPDYVYLHRFAFKFVIMPSITGGDPSEDNDWRVTIDGVNITGYLKEQQGLQPTDPLFSGEDIYPSNGLSDDIENFYDILDVASVMIAEGQDPDDDGSDGDGPSDVYKILRPRFKPVVISAKKPFSVDAYLYLKYSNTNR